MCRINFTDDVSKGTHNSFRNVNSPRTQFKTPEPKNNIHFTVKVYNQEYLNQGENKLIGIQKDFHTHTMEEYRYRAIRFELQH